MLASCSLAVVNVVVGVITLLGSCLAGLGWNAAERAASPSCAVVCAPASGDTSAAAAKPKRPARPEKPVKISITDEGVKVGGQGTVVIEVDADKLEKQLDRALEDLPESLATVFVDDEDKRFFKVRGSDLVQFGNSITIDEDEQVNGDVVCFGDEITVNGKVMGDVVSIFGSISLNDGAIVNGQVVSVFGEVDRADGAVVRGETVTVGGWNPREFGWRWGSMHGPFGGLLGAGARIVMLIVGFLLMLLVLALISNRMVNAAEHVRGSFLKSLGIGALFIIFGTIFVVILAIILAITIIGIPVTILLVLSYAALLLLGYFTSAVALGRFVCEKLSFEAGSRFVHGIVGLFILALFGIIAAIMGTSPIMWPGRAFISVIGSFVKFVALCAGVGAFIISRAGSRRRSRAETLPE